MSAKRMPIFRKSHIHLTTSETGTQGSMAHLAAAIARQTKAFLSVRKTAGPRQATDPAETPVAPDPDRRSADIVDLHPPKGPDTAERAVADEGDIYVPLARRTRG